MFVFVGSISIQLATLLSNANLLGRFPIVLLDLLQGTAPGNEILECCFILLLNKKF